MAGTTDRRSLEAINKPDSSDLGAVLPRTEVTLALAAKRLTEYLGWLPPSLHLT